MNRKIIAVVLLGFVALTALISLATSTVSLGDVLAHPFASLWGRQQEFNTRLLEASENIDPVLVASRRLLKPLGSVELKRIYPAKDSGK